MKKTYRGFAAAAAGIVVCTTIGLNTSQTFAEDMAKLPVIGGIAKSTHNTKLSHRGRFL